MQRGIFRQFRGLETYYRAPLPPFPLHTTDSDLVLRYWRQQGILQKMHLQEKVFIPRIVMLFKYVTSRSSSWATPTSA